MSNLPQFPQVVNSRKKIAPARQTLCLVICKGTGEMVRGTHQVFQSVVTCFCHFFLVDELLI